MEATVAPLVPSSVGSLLRSIVALHGTTVSADRRVRYRAKVDAVGVFASAARVAKMQSSEVSRAVAAAIGIATGLDLTG